MVDSPAVERKLAAIFAADVADYSRLMGADEVGTLRRLQAYRVILDELIAVHRGRIFNTAGDSVVADFASAVDAVECALAVQQAIARENATRPPEQQMWFRIGVHVGDVIIEGSNLYGDTVNIAARLEALAEPGGVCLSGAVRDQIGTRLPVSFTPLGEQRVKNIAEPVRTFKLDGSASGRPMRASGARRRQKAALIYGLVAGAALALALMVAGTVWWLHAGGPAAVSEWSYSAPRLSMVVLPFTNLSNDPQQEYFADGITEDLITDLSRIEGSTVIARNTAFTYKGKGVDSRRIGRELDVRYVVEGSVQRSGKEVRINAQLVDAATGAQLWAERFDRDFGDLFALENNITARIARALQSQLAIAEARRPTDHPDALDYILRGRAVLTRPISKENTKQAQVLFAKALALDPQSAEAAAWLAATLMFGVTDELSDAPDEDLHRAESLVVQALAFSPNNALAHYVKGQVLFAQSRCGEAIPEYETAIALDHSRAPAYARLGWCKFLTGAVDQAIPYFEEAIHLGPHEPSIAPWYGRMGAIYLLQSHVDEAIGWLEKANSENPRLAYVHAYLAAGYALKGDLQRAHTELVQAQSLNKLYSSLASVRKSAWYDDPKIRALAEANYFPALLRAGLPEGGAS
ncbi:MAG: adenylate/guanylate cyclase domain-containing protein [Alphaproteobacteria bacterium]|nr:adenylate/guanylate cyclase domain-containing protein [Alphaproteobacteria bacterium]